MRTKGLLELLLLLIVACTITSIYMGHVAHESKILDLMISIIFWLSIATSWLMFIAKLMLAVSGKTLEDVMSGGN